MKKTDELDKKDRLILLTLDRDSRRSISSISKRLSMPIETVRYRIQRLQSTGLIKKFTAIVDGGRFGFYYYKIFLRLHNTEEKKLRQILTELSTNPLITWVVRVDGNYDIGVMCRVKDPSEQSILLDKIRFNYSNYIKRWSLALDIRSDYFARDFLTGSKTRAGAKGIFSGQKESYKLDEESQTVINALTENARISAKEIAKDQIFSADTVANRIKQLEKNKIILRYSLITDTKLLGHVNVYVLIFLNHLSPKRERDFFEYCSQQSNIVYMVKSLGNWDYELNIEANSIQEYRDLVMRLTSEFSDIIQEYDTLAIDEVLKYQY